MATPSMMPQWSYMHISGQDASEYLSPGLVQFARATETYFSLNNKFRNPTVAPTHDVTTDRSQRLTLRFIPVDREDTAYSYKARFTLAVGDNRVLDMASTYFDIRGVLDRGPTFKPYSGTAYNALAPKGAPNPCEWDEAATALEINLEEEDDDNEDEVDEQAEQQKTHVFGQAPYSGINITKEGIQIGVEGQTPKYADKTFQPEPQIGESQWYETEINHAAGRVLKKTTPMKPCYGSYAKPTNENGGQGILVKQQNGKLESQVEMQFFSTTEAAAGNGDNLTPKVVLYSEDVDIETPDTHISYMPTIKEGNSRELMGQQSMPNRPNYIAFRDNFIGLMYYNSTGNMGVLAGQASQLNAVVDLQDRNTELSYQLLLDSIGDRTRYFSMWNQAVDSYDPDVRIIENHGTEDELPNYCFPLGGVINTETLTKVKPKTGQENGWEKDATEFSDKNEIRVGNNFAMEINLNANLWRNFLYSNIALYLPDKLKYSPSNVKISDNPNTYDYMNKRVVAPGLVDCYINLGARWSLDYMDNVNPFNHHRNAGLRYRSMLLGNGRYVPFHIQVPQKFFAIKNLLLLPGSYTYEWNFRKDVNMVLQSSLGNDLRVDGASIKFDSICLYATFFPMAHNTASTLEAMLRNDTNDQSFNDYLSAANMLYPIPANATNVPISIPSRNWAAFRGWAFTRLKTKETPSLGSGYDPYYTYSGSIPYLDGTFYLNHTFKKVAITFDSSVSWPGNDRLLTPNEFEIKRSVDGEGYNVAQCNMTKDWFLVQMLANYNIGYQGFYIPESYKDRMYSFFRNFQPMSRQVVDDTKYKDYQQVGILHQHNNSGFVGYLAPTMREGQAYPANFPYPLIGKTAVDSITQKKFLCDRTLWRIPFSSNFMSMGALTDLGQNLLYANSAHALDMTFEVDPMDEPTLLYVLFEVFDVVRVHQPHRGVIETVYLRTPFSAGNATT
ncbi:L3 pII [Human mastadenovirus C]|uniref:Hexon protein n=37 Tax=Human mastadenovirus C TaxID=129951 RepID=Q6VGU6_ADE05|nr:L3 pII [Human mastadenovirus C]AAW65514.1 hexon protein [Human adenovirus 5]AZP53459.1 Hexon [Vector Cre.Ad]AZP53489.1 Hexon [Vector LeuRS.Ad]AZP53518.1 Hexon [Vector CFP.delAdPol.GFP]AZP56017.1 L3 pII hexon capsid protein [Vector AdCFP]AZP56050.1 L3 pII hexon capsid protein [Vector tTAwt.mCherry]AZP56083.1 L3 pII hexon capsid protein [Vector tTAmut.GFP]AZP56120.1 L3 pII hexon capsid protein [Vector AdEvolve-DEST]AZP56156.1 L3 pII hexon capsid protein [Vector delprot-delAdPol]MBA571319